jgi:hypothetical protein
MFVLPTQPQTVCFGKKINPCDLLSHKGLYSVGVAGFEPATSSSQTRRDDRATLHPVALVVQIYTIANIKQGSILKY